MNSIFRLYPPGLKVLLPILILQQTCYYLFYQQISASIINYDDENTYSEIAFFLNDYYFIAVGALLILGGWIVDQIKDTRQILLYGISIMLLSHVLVYIPTIFTFVAGSIIGTLSSCVILIKLILHIMVLFPVANDQKDNTFIIANILPVILLTIIGFSAYFFLGLISGVYNVIASMILYLLVLYQVVKHPDIGYEIEDEEPLSVEQSIINNWILLGCILIGTIASIFILYVSSIGPEQDIYYGEDETGLNGLLKTYPVENLLGLVFIIILAIILLQSKKTEPRQYQKLIIGLAGLVLFAGVDFLNSFYSSYSVEYMVEYIPKYWSFLLIEIPLLSILTHINFGKTAGLWLGLLFGVPELVSGVLFNLFPYSSTLAWIGLVLVLASIIYLWENRSAIQEYLALNEPNQEIDQIDDSSVDPIDHLIE